MCHDWGMEIIHAQSRTEEFLRELDKRTAVKVDKLFAILARDGNKIAFPKSRHIRNGIFELRVVGERQIRIFCAFHNGKAYILHIFIKKTWKIPNKEIEYAEKIKNLLALI